MAIEINPILLFWLYNGIYFVQYSRKNINESNLKKNCTFEGFYSGGREVDLSEIR